MHKNSYILFWIFDLFCDRGNTTPAVIRPESTVKGEGNEAEICCRSLKATLQILRISNRQLVDPAKYNDEACKNFAR